MIHVIFTVLAYTNTYNFIKSSSDFTKFEQKLPCGQNIPFHQLTYIFFIFHLWKNIELGECHGSSLSQIYSIILQGFYFLAHLTKSQGELFPPLGILYFLIFSSETIGAIWTKLGRNLSWLVSILSFVR